MWFSLFSNSMLLGNGPFPSWNSGLSELENGLLKQWLWRLKRNAKKYLVWFRAPRGACILDIPRAVFYKNRVARASCVLAQKRKVYKWTLPRKFDSPVVTLLALKSFRCFTCLLFLNDSMLNHVLLNWICRWLRPRFKLNLDSSNLAFELTLFTI